MIRPAALALLLVPVLAAAGEAIVPTADPGSDCVAAKIYAAKTAANRAWDERHCASVNTGRAGAQACLRNVGKERQVAFFTDRCNPEQYGAYVSFNNQTHQVFRAQTLKDTPVSFAGTYRGKDGLEVLIVPRKQLSRQFDADADREFVSYAVDVYIRHRGRSARIRGTYDDSW
jgi:hypothetical protein